jgi:type I restriction enzyme S subunit
VLLPSLEQQIEIANQLDAFEASVSSLAETYRMKIADTDALRQSLLQKAFAGELT